MNVTEVALHPADLNREREAPNQVLLNGRGQEIREGDSFDKTLSTVAKIALVVFLAQLVAPLILPMAIGTIVLLCSPLPLAIGAIALFCSSGSFGIDRGACSYSFRQSSSHRPPAFASRATSDRPATLHVNPGRGATSSSVGGLRRRNTVPSTPVNVVPGRGGNLPRG